METFCNSFEDPVEEEFIDFIRKENEVKWNLNIFLKKKMKNTWFRSILTWYSMITGFKRHIFLDIFEMDIQNDLKWKFTVEIR